MTVHEAIRKHLEGCGLNEYHDYFTVGVLLASLVDFGDALEAIDKECEVATKATFLKATPLVAMFELTWDDEAR